MIKNDWMTTEQAAARLGVKPETLYAYVSRGVLNSERVPGERRSRFLRADVERLAGRQRAGGRAGALEIIVETDLTLLDPTGQLYYRGWDVEDAAAAEASFEEVATWLWTGMRKPERFDAPPELLRAARRATRAVSAVPMMDRIRAVVAAIRSADPLRDDRRSTAVAATARGLIATIVESLPLVAGGPTTASDRSIAARLWPRLSPLSVDETRVRLLDTALVLLADHELAASTLAARVAASTWADPYLVVEAGLAALGGPLHGGSSEAAREVLRGVQEGRTTAAETVGTILRDGKLVPGFGHRVYLDRDPRADALLALLRAVGQDGSPTLRAGVELIDTMRRRDLPFPNIDFAIACLTQGYEMLPEAGELIFAVARIAGWLAHASEEYEHRLRFRPRAAYVGRPPGAAPAQLQ